MLDINGISVTFNPGTPDAKQALSKLSLHLDDGDFVTHSAPQRSCVSNWRTSA